MARYRVVLPLLRILLPNHQKAAWLGLTGCRFVLRLSSIRFQSERPTLMLSSMFRKVIRASTCLLLLLSTHVFAQSNFG
jgi:hypothetical protein